jgi:hypothetical protein
MNGSWYSCYIVHTNAKPDAAVHLDTSKATWMHRNEGESAVAMARVIGDGGWYFHIIDMAVLPEHQSKGLGQVLMEDIMEKIEKDAPPGAYVNLLGSENGSKLYKKFGFVESGPGGNVGMELRMKYPEGKGPDDEKIPGEDDSWVSQEQKEGKKGVATEESTEDAPTEPQHESTESKAAKATKAGPQILSKDDEPTEPQYESKSTPDDGRMPEPKNVQQEDNSESKELPERKAPNEDV